MHTLNRILTALVLMVVLVPPATFALISMDEKVVVQQELQDAIGSAVNSYQQRTGLQSLKTRGEIVMQEESVRLSTLEKRKRELRADLAKQVRIRASVERKHGIELGSKETLQAMITAEKTRMADLVRRQYLRTASMDEGSTRDHVMSLMFHASADAYREEVIGEAQKEFLQDLVAAERAVWRIESLTIQRDDVLTQYHASQAVYDKAAELTRESTERLEQIKAIMEDVHNQVLSLQGELARIDARLKAKAERVLLEKGLIGPGDIGKNDGRVYKPQFSWPVYGRVSAGFRNESYEEHFGVPHHGMDIVTGQGTPVNAAADGVVFLVRDGGATGYSYILIGHRGGYATLYGHVSASLVRAGQEVTAGEAIALSGGKPGTHGAGPMTTGPHLHFEVIKSGANVDPKTVLP